MVATDRNAIGVIQTLTSAGLKLPRDLAIVAFDNIAAGTFSAPTLSTVNQSFDEVGALAGRLILAKMHGEAVPDSTVESESAALMVRESCGCEIDAPHHEASVSDSSPTARLTRLRDELKVVLERELLTGDASADSQSHQTVAQTVRDAMRVVELGDSVTTAQVQAFTTSLRSLTSRPDTLRRLTDAMTDYARRAGTPSAEVADAGSPVPTQVIAALWKAQSGAFLEQAEITDAAIAEQYVVDAGLLDAVASDPRDLLWLTGTRVKAGALALWEGEPSQNRLKIAGVFDPDDALPDLVGTLRFERGLPSRTAHRQRSRGQPRGVRGSAGQHT